MGFGHLTVWPVLCLPAVSMLVELHARAACGRVGWPLCEATAPARCFAHTLLVINLKEETERAASAKACRDDNDCCAPAWQVAGGAAGRKDGAWRGRRRRLTRCRAGWCSTYRAIVCWRHCDGDKLAHTHRTISNIEGGRHSGRNGLRHRISGRALWKRRGQRQMIGVRRSLGMCRRTQHATHLLRGVCKEGRIVEARVDGRSAGIGRVAQELQREQLHCRDGDAHPHGKLQSVGPAVPHVPS